MTLEHYILETPVMRCPMLGLGLQARTTFLIKAVKHFPSQYNSILIETLLFLCITCDETAKI